MSGFLLRFRLYIQTQAPRRPHERRLHRFAPLPRHARDGLHGSRAVPAAADGGKARDARAGEASRRLPLAFEANKGQADSRVKFLARGARNTLFLTEREAVLSLAGREGSPAESLRMTFSAGNANARINGVDQLPGKTNYLLGKDPAAWHTGISSYGAVRYERIYRGVDLVFHGSDERQLEYDFIVDPGADPRVIRLHFEGANRLTIDAAGNLVISMAGGDLMERAPVAYQEIDGVRRPVAARYELHGKNEIGVPGRALRPATAADDRSGAHLLDISRRQQHRTGLWCRGGRLRQRVRDWINLLSRLSSDQQILAHSTVTDEQL